MAERTDSQVTADDPASTQPRGLAYLPLAYIWPALLWGLALGSALLAYLYLAGYSPLQGRARFGHLDHVTYYGFEAAVFFLLAWLSTRAVRRGRRGKDLWTMRAYWPVVLSAFALVGVGVYALSIVGTARGCDVGAWYFLWGCWDPGVTALRTTLALVLTAGFTFGVARWVEGPIPRPATDAAPDEAEPAEDEDDVSEEIPAR